MTAPPADTSINELVLLRDRWARDPSLQREFSDNFDTFLAFERAAARGLVRIYSPIGGPAATRPSRSLAQAEAGTVNAVAKFIAARLPNPSDQAESVLKVAREFAAADAGQRAAGFDLVAALGAPLFQTALAARWRASPKDRAEFQNDFAAFESYCLALARGQVGGAR